MSYIKMPKYVKCQKYVKFQKDYGQSLEKNLHLKIWNLQNCVCVCVWRGHIRVFRVHFKSFCNWQFHGKIDAKVRFFTFVIMVNLNLIYGDWMWKHENIYLEADRSELLVLFGLKSCNTVGLINWSFLKMVKDEPLDYKKYKILNDLVMSAKLPWSWHV